MNLSVSTHIQMSPTQVWDGFDDTLFTKLAPPFPLLKLLRFDGSMPEDEVHIELNFLIFKQKWHSRIVEHKTTSKEIYFIDEGIKLPFFLKRWQHKHRLVANPKGGTSLIDEISYQTPFVLLDWLLYPAMLGQFLYRKPVYQKVFGKPNH